MAVDGRSIGRFWGTADDVPRFEAASPFWFPDYPSRCYCKGWTRGIESLRQYMEAGYRDAWVLAMLRVEQHIVGQPINPSAALRTGSRPLFGAASYARAMPKWRNPLVN